MSWISLLIFRYCVIRFRDLNPFLWSRNNYYIICRKLPWWAGIFCSTRTVVIICRSAVRWRLFIPAIKEIVRIRSLLLWKLIWNGFGLPTASITIMRKTNLFPALRLSSSGLVSRRSVLPHFRYVKGRRWNSLSPRSVPWSLIRLWWRSVRCRVAMSTWSGLRPTIIMAKELPR